MEARLSVRDDASWVAIDKAVNAATPVKRRALITEHLQTALRVALRCDEGLEVYSTIDPYDLITHFDVRVSGFAAVAMRDVATAEQVRRILLTARERYKGVLEGVPEEEATEEARALTDDELRARTRALRGKKKG